MGSGAWLQYHCISSNPKSSFAWIRHMNESKRFKWRMEAWFTLGYVILRAICFDHHCLFSKLTIRSWSFYGRLHIPLSPAKSFSLFMRRKNMKYMRFSPFPPLTHALTHTGKYACNGTRETGSTWWFNRCKRAEKAHFAFVITLNPVRNQQVVCSSHIASSKQKPHRKAVWKLSVRFLFVSQMRIC